MARSGRRVRIAAASCPPAPAMSSRGHRGASRAPRCRRADRTPAARSLSCRHHSGTRDRNARRLSPASTRALTHSSPHEHSCSRIKVEWEMNRPRPRRGGWPQSGQAVTGIAGTVLKFSATAKSIHLFRSSVEKPRLR